MFHSLLLGPPTAFTAHHQESTESENFRLRISFLQIYQELLHWMDLKGMMWPKHRFDMGWIWNEPGTTQWDVRCVRFFFLPACIFLDRKRSMTFWTLHCSSLKVEMHWGWGIYKLDMRYHNVSQIVPIPKEMWLWIPKKRHILIPRVEVLFSSIRHLCQALEIGATCVRGQFVSMGFWLLFPSQILSLLHHWIAGSEDGLRLRWDAVRGFFVENLFEYLSCFSEFRNPDLAVVILVDVLGGGFDCLHPRCPQLHLLLHVLCRYQCTSAEDALQYYHAGVQRPLLAKPEKIEDIDVIPIFFVHYQGKQMASTAMNIASSRSHSVLILSLLRRCPGWWFYEIEAIGPWGICWSQWPTSSSNGLCGEGIRVDFLRHLKETVLPTEADILEYEYLYGSKRPVYWAQMSLWDTLACSSKHAGQGGVDSSSQSFPNININK